MAIIYNAVALCALGAEKTVSNELRKLGVSIEEGGFGRIRFKTGLDGLYRSLICLRAADKVFLEVSSYEAQNFDELFEGTLNQSWEEYIPKGMGLRVTKVRTNRSKLGAETSIQAVVHKAAAQRLCSKRGINRLPEGVENAELRVYIEKNRVSVLLDLCGEPLFKRGYRSAGGLAPLRESTAASIILLSGWRRKFPLHDPFCGSGTIVIEAAMYAWDIAPGIGRHFSLEKLLFANRKTEQGVREESLAKVDFSRRLRISGSDSDATVVDLARSNLKWVMTGFKAVGLQTLPSFNVLPMEKAKPIEESKEDEGFIITNPPYGRRLGDAEAAEKTYAEMGKLVRNFPGWKLALITDHPGFESFFGKKADLCREITNGAIQSYLFQFKL